MTAEWSNFLSRLIRDAPAMQSAHPQVGLAARRTDTVVGLAAYRIGQDMDLVDWARSSASPSGEMVMRVYQKVVQRGLSVVIDWSDWLRHDAALRWFAMGVSAVGTAGWRKGGGPSEAIDLRGRWHLRPSQSTSVLLEHAQIVPSPVRSLDGIAWPKSAIQDGPKTEAVFIASAYTDPMTLARLVGEAVESKSQVRVILLARDCDRTPPSRLERCDAGDGRILRYNSVSRRPLNDIVSRIRRQLAHQVRCSVVLITVGYLEASLEALNLCATEVIGAALL